MIKTVNLSKNYGNNKVLENINLEIEDKKIYGLLGRNGVGKTTLLKILSNLIVSYSGEAKIDGSNIKENQALTENILFISDTMLPDSMKNYKIKNIFKNVSLFLPNWNEEFKDFLLKDFNLNPNVKLKQLSKGNKNLISLIIGLASGAKYTFFDEPSIGLDANNRYKFYNYILKISEDSDRTIIVSTHIIDEAESVFEKVIILEDKKVMLDEEIDEIQEKALSFTGSKSEIMNIIGNKNIIKEENIGAVSVISIYDNLSVQERQSLNSEGIQITNLPLQKLFIYLTSQEESNASN